MIPEVISEHMKLEKERGTIFSLRVLRTHCSPVESLACVGSSLLLLTCCLAHHCCRGPLPRLQCCLSEVILQGMCNMHRAFCFYFSVTQMPFPRIINALSFVTFQIYLSPIIASGTYCLAREETFLIKFPVAACNKMHSPLCKIQKEVVFL